MTRFLWLVGAIVIVLGLTAGCEKQKGITGTDGTNGVPIDTTAVVPDSLVLARTFPPLLANGVDAVTIYATVVDRNGKGLSGIGVTFTTTRGAIEPFATTGGDGRAGVELTSAASSTDILATVTATAANKSAAGFPSDARILVSRRPLSDALVDLAVRGAAASPTEARPAASTMVEDVVSVPMTGITLSVQASPGTIPADAISESQIVARLIETTRGVPVPDQVVHFGASQGSITGSATTDDTGAATAVLRAAPGQVSSQVTAYYGRTLTAQTSVVFSPLTLTIAAAVTAVPADGASSVAVTAHLVNQSGNPVVGARIDFTTTAGTITSPVNTDEKGQAVATLVSASAPASARITAQFLGLLNAETTVQITPLPGTAGIVLEADPSALPADGVSTARIVARVLDASANPVPDGTVVEFALQSGTGRIISPVQHTSGGTATAEYVAGTAAGVETIEATSGTHSRTVSILLQSLDPATLTLAAQPSSILADGNAATVITATVTDLLGHPVAPGTEIAFSTSRGILEGATPTDANGRASVRLRATRFQTGVGRVTASAGPLRSTVDIRFVSEDAAHIEAVRVDPPRIGVLGASDHETSTITFEAQDHNGIPVDLDHAVTLSVAMRPLDLQTDATVYPVSATTDAAGRILATVNAGLISGVVMVHAASGPLLSQPVRIAIHGDLPDPAHFSIFFEKINIAGLVYAGILNHVTAKIGDEHGNPVPDSTAAWFSAAYGIVQGSGFTGSVGDAVVLSETAGPFPQIPGGDGLVRICAQTVSKAGERITTCSYVMWSGPTIVEITSPTTSFNIPNGGSIPITFRVRDANFNPLTGGTKIAVTTTAGKLGGDTDVTLPDTQSDDYTNFRVTLSDDDPATNEPTAVTVSIKVTSTNGNRNASIDGVLN